MESADAAHGGLIAGHEGVVQFHLVVTVLGIIEVQTAAGNARVVAGDSAIDDRAVAVVAHNPAAPFRTIAGDCAIADGGVSFGCDPAAAATGRISDD